MMKKAGTKKGIIKKRKNRGVMSVTEAVRRGVFTGTKSGERMSSATYQKRHQKNLKKIQEMGYSKIELLDD